MTAVIVLTFNVEVVRLVAFQLDHASRVIGFEKVDNYDLHPASSKYTGGCSNKKTPTSTKSKTS